MAVILDESPAAADDEAFGALNDEAGAGGPAYPLQVLPHAGARVTTTTPSPTGDQVPTGAGIALLVQNSTPSPITVTLTIGRTYDGLPVTPRQVSCPGVSGTTDGLTLIPVPDTVYGLAAAVSYSAVNGVGVAALAWW